VRAWFARLWDTMNDITIGYIVAGVTFQTVQTTLTALAWYFILAAGYPDGGVRYATSSPHMPRRGHERLPAGEHRHVRLAPDVHGADPGSTFSGMLGAMTVQKIFYTVIGTLVYVYLFLSVPGSFELQLGVVDDTACSCRCSSSVGRFSPISSSRVLEQARVALGERQAGRCHPGEAPGYVVKVLLPSFGSWVAKLCVIAVFLAAYGIPVTFHTIMSWSAATPSRTPSRSRREAWGSRRRSTPPPSQT